MSYPAWIYEELAYPGLEFNDLNMVGGDSGDALLTISGPAIRASVQCTPMDEEDFVQGAFSK